MRNQETLAVPQPLGAETQNRRRWLILGIVTLASFITNVDATIVVIGLPRMIAGLHTSVTTGLWTLTAYIITSTVFLLPAGRWSDSVGRRRIFVAGMGIFTVGTALCGVATSGETLVGYRFIQGAGAALALATAVPLLVETFPSGRLGQALGINSTAWVFGSIVGPVFGGVLVGDFGWRSIFYVTVPFGALGVVLGALFLPPDRRGVVPVRTDWPGIATFGGSLIALMLALSESLAWGWTSWRILGLFGAAIILAAAFCVRELRARDALFDLHLLRNAHYRTCLAVVLCYGTGFFASTFLLTFYLQGAVNLSPVDAGLMLVPLSAPQLVSAPLGGSIADRIGPARPLCVGLFFLALGAVWLGLLGPHLSVPSIVLPLLVMSAANGLAWPSLMKAVMSSAPAERSGVASGMFFTLRNVGMSLSFTLALVVAEASLPPATAVRIFLGTGGVLGTRETANLVRSTDAGFHLFVAFYALALLLSLRLLRPAGGPSSTLETSVADSRVGPSPARS